MKLSVRLKNLFLAVVIAGVAVGASFLFEQAHKAQNTTKTSPALGLTVVIDAGHGGIDPGSVGKTTKTTEREINLAIANHLKSYLESANFDVVMTRKDENGLYGVYDKNYKLRDMQARRDIIVNSSASLLVSIHINSFTDSSRRGAQVFYDTTLPDSEKLALCVQKCFQADLPESTRGISVGDYYILKCSNIPSILCECGYISNKTEEALLVSAEHQLKIAYSIFKGIIAYIS